MSIVKNYVTIKKKDVDVLRIDHNNSNKSKIIAMHFGKVFVIKKMGSRKQR